MSQESGFNEAAIREKFAKKLEEIKLQADREKEVRIAVEDSHQSLLSRIQDMESAVEQERKHVRINRQLAEKNVVYFE